MTQRSQVATTRSTAPPSATSRPIQPSSSWAAGPSTSTDIAKATRVDGVAARSARQLGYRGARDEGDRRLVPPRAVVVVGQQLRRAPEVALQRRGERACDQPPAPVAEVLAARLGAEGHRGADRLPAREGQAQRPAVIAQGAAHAEQRAGPARREQAAASVEDRGGAVAGQPAGGDRGPLDVLDRGPLDRRETQRGDRAGHQGATPTRRRGARASRRPRPCPGPRPTRAASGTRARPRRDWASGGPSRSAVSRPSRPGSAPPPPPSPPPAPRPPPPPPPPRP